MNELAINIEYLLLTRNSVVVPGLGAFSTRKFASQWLEEEELFLPPVRHIRFNADIFQDSEEVFLRSLSQIYGLSEEEAQKRCEEMVASFHKSLVTEGTVDFGSIGLFTLEDDAEITMAPYECGVTSPDYYGLDTLHFPLLTNLPEEISEQIVEPTMVDSASDDISANSAETDSVQDEKLEVTKKVILPTPKTYVADDKHIIIRLNRAVVRYTMVAAASVLMFLLLGPDVKNEDAATGVRQATTNAVIRSAGTKNTVKTTHAEKSVNPLVVTPAPDADSASLKLQTEVAPVTEKVAEAQNDKVEEEVQAKMDNQQILTELRGSHSIVLASAVSLKNAKSFVSRLESKDVHAIIYDNGKMLRVVIDGFNSQADAYNVNHYLHGVDKELGSTWVMKN